MVAAIERSTRELRIIQEIDIEPTEMTSCFQVKEKLDALFYGDSRLEETHMAIKRVLFRHLETCETCCRVFDVRVRFCSGSGRGIL